MNPEVALVWLLQGGILRRGQPDPDPALRGTRPRDEHCDVLAALTWNSRGGRRGLS